jgi:hypothetical protein
MRDIHTAPAPLLACQNCTLGNASCETAKLAGVRRFVIKSRCSFASSSARTRDIVTHRDRPRLSIYGYSRRCPISRGPGLGRLGIEWVSLEREGRAPQYPRIRTANICSRWLSVVGRRSRLGPIAQRRLAPSRDSEFCALYHTAAFSYSRN